MYLKYENGCVLFSFSGEPGSFSPLFFCDEGVWLRFLFDGFEPSNYDDFCLDDGLSDEPFDYDFDI